MTTVTQRLPLPPPVRRPRLTGPLLIVGGQGSSIGGALRVAQALARRDEVHTHVLGVARPLPRQASRAAAQPAAIAMAARARRAEYILTGLPPTGTAAAREALESFARLADAAGVPVLGVPADWDGLPRRALVRMERGEVGMRAASAALALLDQGGMVALAAPPGEAAGLRRFSAALGGLAGVEVGIRLLPGGPGRSTALVRRFDLVVTGAPPPGPALVPADHDPLLGHSAGCVLIVPASEAGTAAAG